MREILQFLGWTRTLGRIFPLVFLVVGLQAGDFSESDGWTTKSFAKFDELKMGTLGDAGANLFLSKKGVLGPIHSWDYNADGYADIIFNNTHDHAFEIPLRVYRNTKGVASPEDFLELPASGGASMAVADLNADGFQEIISVNGNNNTTGHQNSVIYWGDKAGWDASRKTELLTLRGDHVTIADLNGDGHLDLVFGNRGDKPGENSESFIYWGNGSDFSAERRTALRTNYAMASEAFDGDQDGRVDLIFANRGNAEDDGSVVIYSGGEDGFRNYHRSQLGDQRATGLARADLDGDGWEDLAVSDLRTSEKNASGIFYGGLKGFLKENFVSLPVPDAAAVAVGDFDGDGKTEIAMATYVPNRENDGEVLIFKPGEGHAWKQAGTLKVKEPTALTAGDADGDGVIDLLVAEQRDGANKSLASHLFLGGPKGLQADNTKAFPTFGAADGAIADVNGDGRAEILFANGSTGRSYGDIDSYVYWGNPDHAYSVDRRTGLPTIGGYNSVMTDFNGDGVTDVLLVTSGEDDPKDFLKTGSFIYLGSKDGLSPERRLVMPEGSRGFGGTTADLNQDGYLDIVLGDLYGECTSIYYGSEEGFQAAKPKKLGDKGAFYVRVADLNRDGLLDIITPRIGENRTVIYWNSPDGFHDEDFQELMMSGPSISEFADLNGDGWLDMIVGGFWDGPSMDQRTPTAIYWGNENGFSTYNRTLLLQSGVTDVSVADLNQDGHLDLVCSNYHGNSTRAINSFVYWGNGKDFSDARRTALPTYSASGNLIMDLNEDGWLDIVFSNHNRNNDHHNDSMIYWGGKDGFSPEQVTWLLAIGPHNMADADAGNLFTRDMQEVYTSPILSLEEKPSEVALTWEAETPRGTLVEVRVRGADSEPDLKNAVWSEPVEMGKPIPDLAGRPYWQYQVVFRSATGAAQARLLGLSQHVRKAPAKVGNLEPKL